MFSVLLQILHAFFAFYANKEIKKSCFYKLISKIKVVFVSAHMLRWYSLDNLGCFGQQNLLLWTLIENKMVNKLN